MKKPARGTHLQRRLQSTNRERAPHLVDDRRASRAAHGHSARAGRRAHVRRGRCRRAATRLHLRDRTTAGAGTMVGAERCRKSLPDPSRRCGCHRGLLARRARDAASGPDARVGASEADRRRTASAASSGGTRTPRISISPRSICGSRSSLSIASHAGTGSASTTRTSSSSTPPRGTACASYRMTTTSGCRSAASA